MDRAMKLPELKAFERLVLLNLAWRANKDTSICWPAVDRIAIDTGVSERQVYRALKILKGKGLIVSTGIGEHGTVRYLVTIPTASLTASVKKELAVNACQPGGPPMPSSHPNMVTESGSEIGNTTSPEMPGQVCPPETNPNQPTTATPPTPAHLPTHPPSQPQAAKPSGTSEGIPAATLASQPSKDSKVVAVWKAAHEKAGLKCTVSGKNGFQLGQLAKGEQAIPYAQVISQLIPIAVSEWQDMCLYIRGYLSWSDKIKVPSVPDTGFLLVYRAYAANYCSHDDKEVRKHLVKLYGKSPAKPQSKHPLDYDD